MSSRENEFLAKKIVKSLAPTPRHKPARAVLFMKHQNPAWARVRACHVEGTLARYIRPSHARVLSYLTC